MHISKERFIEICHQQQISSEKAESLWTSIETEKPQANNIFSHTLYYLGAFIIIIAMGWFATFSWSLFGGAGLFLISTAYALILTFIGNEIWKRSDLRVPAGLMITTAVCLVPLAIYGLLLYLKIWPESSGEVSPLYNHALTKSWLYLDIGTLLAGILAIAFFPFPFLTAPIFLSAWVLAIDLGTYFNEQSLYSDITSWITVWFGLGTILISFILDRIKKRDYAFWGYFFGGLAFWSGLSILVMDRSELVFFGYFMVNILMMGLSLALKRNIFLILGFIGVFIYLAHLANVVFQNYPILFTLSLSLIGLGIIYLGIIYRKRQS